MTIRRRVAFRNHRRLVDEDAPVPPPVTDVEFVAAGASANAAANGVEPGLPAGIEVGDVLICAAAMRGSGAPSMSGDWTQGESPQGYVSPAALTEVAAYLIDAGSGTTIPQVWGDGSADLQSFGTVGGWSGTTYYSAQYLVAPGVTGTVYDAVNGATQITIVLDIITGTDLPDNGEMLFGLGLDENQLANLRLGMFFSAADSGDARLFLNNAEVWSDEGPIFTANTHYTLVIVIDTPNDTGAQRVRVHRYDGTDFDTIGTTGTVTEDTALSFTSGTDEMIVGVPVGENSGTVGAMFWYVGAADATTAQSLAEQVFADNDAAPSLGGAADTSLTWWWHRYSGVAPDTEITRTSSDCITAGIVAYRNVEGTGDPIDASSFWFDTGGVASADIEMGDPALETVTADAMVVFLSAEAGNSAVATPSGGGVTWVERFDAGTSLGSDVRLAIASGLKLTPGAVGATTTASSSGRHVGMGLALIPEA